ncbi:chymotrypsin-2-like [Phymastichus coffea]|uniref:chymotrypsin-2-like n=1 Tax=Phymastichus coffea TaxID=108790 RepID=UPI00273CA8B9|nr:chymotrypsin-2-like [Phymastichus coffea]
MIGFEVGPDIVNGRDVMLKEIPYQVSLQIVGYHFCGGSIISPYYVLTAAHCTAQFNDTTVPFIYAAAGMINVYEPGQSHYVQKFIAHEKYNPKDSFRNDISLARLKTPFIYNLKIQPVTLPKLQFVVPANTSVVLSGWGNLGGKDNKSPTILQEVTLHVVDQEMCRKDVETNKKDHLYKTNICAFDGKTRKGQCGGDSGGPLTWNKVQVGLVSWSVKDPYCASVKTPGIYTRVSEYIEWIKKNAM